VNVVHFENVTRLYPKGVTALRDVSLSLPEGTVYGLVGRNGAGKTTLLRMIPALLHPTTGSVRVFDLDPWEHQETVKRNLGYLSEDDVLPARARIRDLVDLCASLYPNWDAPMAASFLDHFELDPASRIGRLSKGQKRQVGLICAVSHRPRLLVLDEPAGGLDPAARREFLEVVIDLLADAGSTVILSSHLMSDLERIAQHLLVLHRGALILDAPLDDLKENFCRAELAGPGVTPDQLLHSPACLRAERSDSHLTATFRCAPHALPPLLHTDFPDLHQLQLLNAVPLNLEDIFIELTRNNS